MGTLSQRSLLTPFSWEFLIRPHPSLHPVLLMSCFSSGLTFHPKVFASSVTIKLCGPGIMTVMMASDHAVYNNDKTWLATCLHSLLISLTRAVGLTPRNFHLPVIKSELLFFFSAVWTSFCSDLEIAHVAERMYESPVWLASRERCEKRVKELITCPERSLSSCGICVPMQPISAGGKGSA